MLINYLKLRILLLLSSFNNNDRRKCHAPPEIPACLPESRLTFGTRTRVKNEAARELSDPAGRSLVFARSLS